MVRVFDPVVFDTDVFQGLSGPSAGTAVLGKTIRRAGYLTGSIKNVKTSNNSKQVGDLTKSIKSEGN